MKSRQPEPARVSFEVTISARVFEDVVHESKKNAAELSEYENFSHYVRVALIDLNNHHKGQPTKVKRSDRRS